MIPSEYWKPIFRSKILNDTYTKNSIDEGVVATVRHSQPMATEEYDINISVTEAEIVPLAWLLYIK